MARKRVFSDHLRRALIIIFAALAGTAIYLWLARAPAEAKVFQKVYQASLTQAAGNMKLGLMLGSPIQAARGSAKYHFSHSDGHRTIHYEFILQGSQNGALVEGEAISLGNNWLIVKLVARFGNGAQLNLTPNVEV